MANSSRGHRAQQRGGDSFWQVLGSAQLPRWDDQALWKQLLSGAFKLCLNGEGRPAVNKAFSLKPFTMLWSKVRKIDSNNGYKIETWVLAPFPGNDWQLEA